MGRATWAPTPSGNALTSSPYTEQQASGKWLFRRLRTSHGPSGAEDYSPGCEPGVPVEERERTPEWQRSTTPDQECVKLRPPCRSSGAPTRRNPIPPVCTGGYNPGLLRRRAGDHPRPSRWGLPETADSRRSRWVLACLDGGGPPHLQSTQPIPRLEMRSSLSAEPGTGDGSPRRSQPLASLPSISVSAYAIAGKPRQMSPTHPEGERRNTALAYGRPADEGYLDQDPNGPCTKYLRRPQQLPAPHQGSSRRSTGARPGPPPCGH